jgi:hypothetical protein
LIWPCVLGYCPAERWINLPVSGGKQIKPGFHLGFCLCLTPLRFYFILKNSTVLHDYKHTHNIMQPPLCLKIWRVVLSNVLYWICPKHNNLYSEPKMYCFATFFAVLLQCPVANRMHILEYVYYLQGSLFFTLSFRLLSWSNYNVVDPSSVLLSQPLNPLTVLKSPFSVSFL